MNLTNHQARLAARPVGMPKRSDLRNFPEALLKLFTGENFGKLILKVAES